MDIKKYIKEVNIRKIIVNRKLRAETREGYVRLLAEILFVLIVAAIIFTQIFIVARVSGTGMYPAINDGDIAIAYRFAYGFNKNYLKKDAVIYKYDGIWCFGRVVACGGDVVDIDDNGSLFVNGTDQDGEIVFRTDKKGDLKYPYTVPEGYYFILGDYRTRSIDSRDFGPVSKDRVKGKIITIFRTTII